MKLNSNYDSVRKAFLAIDQDHDGFITIEDFLKTFEEMGELDYHDIKKLINSKDKIGGGKMSYEDFSDWLGNCIHMSEGFYFRHDSIKNIGFERA